MSEQNRAVKCPRFLVVEDDVVATEQARSVLVAEGYSVETAANGLQGLAKFQCEEFAGVVIDLRMPTLDGRRAAAMMRRWESQNRLHQTPLIAMSTSLGPIDALSPHDPGAAVFDGYLEKPIIYRKLEEILSKRTVRAGRIALTVGDREGLATVVSQSFEDFGWKLYFASDFETEIGLFAWADIVLVELNAIAELAHVGPAAMESAGGRVIGFGLFMEGATLEFPFWRLGLSGLISERTAAKAAESLSIAVAQQSEHLPAIDHAKLISKFKPFPNLLQKAVACVRESGPRLLLDTWRSYLSCDFSAFTCSVHSLASTVGNVCADQLCFSLKEVERLARQRPETGDLFGPLCRATQEFSRFETELKAFETLGAE